MKAHDHTLLPTFGTIGHNHLLGAAQRAFAAAESHDADTAAKIEAGIRLLCMAWAEFPLNTPLAAQVVTLAGKSPLVERFLTHEGVQVAQTIASLGQGGDDQIAHSLFAAGEYDGLEAHFDALTGQGQALAIARQAGMLMSMLSRWEWLESFVRGPLAAAEPLITDLMLPDILLATRNYEQAVKACEKLVSLCGMSFCGVRLALAHAGLGDADKAVRILGRVLAENPEHSTALLLMDSLAFPVRRDVRLPGTCVVSIYSYNKADELARTLESVLASDLGAEVGDIHVRVLINGSEDESLAVAEAARDGYSGSMDVVALPVNVGAPAARNWLLDAARRDSAQWIVFLDDDVLVPHDWLRGLAAGTEDFPDAGVWGCRVADAMSPSLTQHADGFLLPSDAARQQGHDLVLQEPGTECLVSDCLRYRRYCASVTGCCHLFRVDELSKNGGFDLLFSPSQFDDLDSDLRLLHHGKPAAYLGDVCITHLRLANPFIQQSEGARIQGENHRSLLEARHGGLLDELLGIQAECVLKDLEFRQQRLRKAGLLPYN